MTESKHMSETQDIRELADSLVTIDTALRSQSWAPESCEKGVIVDTFNAAGSYCGAQLMVEGETMTMSGIDVSPDGKLFIIMKVDDPDPTAPVKWHLTAQMLEDCFPGSFDTLDFMVPTKTTSTSLGWLSNVTNNSLKGKVALIDVVRNHLKEGRRALLEGKAEAEELAAESFYKEQSDYGIF